MSSHSQWITIGHQRDLIPGAGVGARVNNRQVALFWIPEMDNRVFAVSNFCPFSGVHIIARGIVGDIQGEPVVASPLYKQHFSLIDGRCLEKPEVVLETWEVRMHEDRLQIRMQGESELAA